MIIKPSPVKIKANGGGFRFFIEGELVINIYGNSENTDKLKELLVLKDSEQVN